MAGEIYEFISYSPGFVNAKIQNSGHDFSDSDDNVLLSNAILHICRDEKKQLLLASLVAHNQEDILRTNNKPQEGKFEVLRSFSVSTALTEKLIDEDWFYSDEVGQKYLQECKL